MARIKYGARIDMVSNTFVPSDDARRKPLDGNASPSAPTDLDPREGGINLR